MARYDDPFISVFPTRHGVAQGGARERQMLDSVNGSPGIRTKIANNSDGTTTLLKTRAGMPEFTTPKGGVKKTCFEQTVSRNHGFVDTTFNINGLFDQTSLGIQQLFDSAGDVTEEDRLYVKDTHVWKQNFNDRLPSNFSGMMRRLMQNAHGVVVNKHGKQYDVAQWETCRKPAYSSDEFSCVFSMTHGLFISSTGRRWVIEVSAEGIFRIPISFASEFSSSDTRSAEAAAFGGSTNYQEAADSVSKYWTVTRFSRSDKEKIGDAPACYSDGYSPWYSWCGWAFDYTGSKATIALSRTHPVEPSWWQVALFDIAISADADGNPLSASTTKSEEGPLAISANDGGDNFLAAIQAPWEFPGTIKTHGIYSSISIGTLISAPIFSFYEEGGAKAVYRLDTYGVDPVYETMPDYVYENVTISPAGDWTIGNFIAGSVSTYPNAPYTHPVISESSVDCSAKTGSSGGAFGFSGPGLPHQNTDFAGYISTRRLVDSGTGAIRPAGVVKNHVSRVTGSRYDIGAYDIADFLPYIDQLNFNVYGDATAVSVETTPPYGYSKSHLSTLVLTGYDRESVVFAHTIQESSAEHTETLGFWANGRLCKLTSYPLCERTPTFGTFGESGAGPLSAGTIDWCLYVDNRNGTHTPSHITGWYDSSPMIGRIASQDAIFVSMTDGSYASVNEYYNKPIAAKTDITRTVYLRSAGMNVVVNGVPDGELHRTHHGTDIFRMWVGSSSFVKPGAGISMFYSPNANHKPIVVGVGSHALGERSLFGFIGVF